MTQPSIVYIDHMGSDLDIVNDARISFSKLSKPGASSTVTIPYTNSEISSRKIAVVPALKKEDIGLIQFLARGCTSASWNDAVRAIVDSMSSAEADALLTWAKRMPTHWTPFGHQIMKFRVKAPVPIRTQC